MKKLYDKKKLVSLLAVAQFLMGVFTLVGYAVVFYLNMNAVYQQRTFPIFVPLLFIGVTGWKRSVKKALIADCYESLESIRALRDNGEMKEETFSKESLEIRAILFKYYDQKA